MCDEILNQVTYKKCGHSVQKRSAVEWCDYAKLENKVCSSLYPVVASAKEKSGNCPDCK